MKYGSINIDLTFWFYFISKVIVCMIDFYSLDFNASKGFFYFDILNYAWVNKFNLINIFELYFLSTDFYLTISFTEDCKKYTTTIHLLKKKPFDSALYFEVNYFLQRNLIIWRWLLNRKPIIVWVPGDIKYGATSLLSKVWAWNKEDLIILTGSKKTMKEKCQYTERV